MTNSFLEPLFQPIFSRDGELFAYEALLRFRGSVESPADQIKRWERTGYIPVMDVTMARRVGKQLAANGSQPRVALNVSIVTVESAAEYYLAALSEVERNVKLLIIELTETVPIKDMNAVMRFCLECRGRGIALALDDCHPGHPYIEPQFIKKIRPSLVKIDGVYLQNCFKDRTIVGLESIIKTSHDHGAAVVAEFISDMDVHAFALSLGVDFFQGFALGLPASLPSVSIQPLIHHCI